MNFAIYSVILLFTLSAFANQSFVDSPDQCLGLDKYPCSVRSVKGPLSMEKGGHSFVLDANSAVHFETAQEFKLLSGQVWIEKSENLSLKISPSLTINLNGEFFAQKLSDKLWLKNLDGETQFKSSHVFQSESLPVGFENWYGRITTKGSIDRGIIKPIELKDFLVSWLPLAQNSVAVLKKKVASYRELWSKAPEQSSELYKEIVERRMASVTQRELTQEQQVEKARKAIQKIREMYRQKNYLEPSEEAP